MQKVELIAHLEEIAQEMESVALKIWHEAELPGEEAQASNLYRQLLAERGFQIKEFNGEKLEHAFLAEYGQGSPVIAILAEYDALPGLSQEVCTTRQPRAGSTTGHGCGHNLLGAASYGAALALKHYLDESKQSGTIRFFGCPEEETLVGKVRMLMADAFVGCDVALSWHPMNVNAPLPESFLANNSIKFRFHGISAHAAQSPEAGRSALDAVELMNVGANYLREHIIEKARLHYTITNAGTAPNIIPSEAESWYYVRAPHRLDVKEITKRLLDIAKGAALMTGTTVDHEIISGCYESLPNQVMFELTYKNMAEVDTPVYTEEELAFAKAIQETLAPQSIAQERQKFSMDEGGECFIHSGLLPKERCGQILMTGSSDSGDVSWNMPMNVLLTAAWPIGVAAHSWQATASSGHRVGLKGMLYAAKVFTGMAYDLLNQPDLVAQAREEFARRTAQTPYECPLSSPAQD